MANYIVYGPFLVPRKGRRIADDRDSRGTFWEKVDKKKNGLSEAIGCYVFVVGVRARYIGMTWRRSFKRECFEPHKLNVYNRALQDRRAKPRLIFIARLTKNSAFGHPTKKKSKTRDEQPNKYLESVLIYEAKKNGRRIENTIEAKRVERTMVPGLLNTRQGQARAKAVQALRKALGYSQ